MYGARQKLMVMPDEILIGGVRYVPKINEDKYPESGYGEDFIDTRYDDMSDPLKGNGKYALQTIIISKDVPLDRAEQSAKDISKKKKLMMREKEDTRHFRVLPPNRFIKKTFRSKKINPDITLTFGELKPEYEKLVGHGFFDYFKKGYDYVKDTISGVKEKAVDTASNIKDTLVSAKDKAVEYLKPRLDDYNNRTKEMLKEYGQEKVTKAVIYRKPIDAYIPVVLNLVSLGKWNEAVKKVGYDKFFHLSLIVEVKGEMLNVEKLDVVSITKGVPQGKGVESFNVPLKGKSFTLLEMLETARQAVGDKAFFEYDSFENNCQSFVSYLLKGQGLYGEEEKGFTYQPIKSIVDEMPDYVKKFQRGLTDISATINKILGLGMSGGQMLPFAETEEQKMGHAERLASELKKIGKFYGLSGGNQMSGFIRAMMASKSTDPETIQKGKDKLARTNRARAKRGEPKLTLKQFNEARSIPKKIDVPVMSQSSYNMITKADEEGKEKKIKKFYEFISQKIEAGLESVNGLYPIDELYEEFQGKKETDRKKAHAEVEKAGRTKRRGKPPREKQTEEQKAEKRREAQRKYYAKKKGVAPEEKKEENKSVGQITAERITQELKDEQNPLSRRGRLRIKENEEREKQQISSVDKTIENINGYYKDNFKKLTQNEKKDLKNNLDLILGYKHIKKGYVYEALKNKIDAFEIPSYISKRFYTPKEEKKEEKKEPRKRIPAIKGRLTDAEKHNNELKTLEDRLDAFSKGGVYYNTVKRVDDEENEEVDMSVVRKAVELEQLKKEGNKDWIDDKEIKDKLMKFKVPKWIKKEIEMINKEKNSYRKDQLVRPVYTGQGKGSDF